MTQGEAASVGKEKSPSCSQQNIQDRKMTNSCTPEKKRESVKKNVIKNTPRTLRVHRNGNNLHPVQIIPITVNMERSLDWSHFLDELNKSVTYPGCIRRVYNLKGKKLSAFSDLDDIVDIVVSSGESFKMLPYALNMSTIQNNVHTRPHSGGSKVRRSDRAVFTKSVILEPTSLTDDPTIVNPLMKTCSEQDVSCMKSNCDDNGGSGSPMASVSVHQSHSSRSRPVSSYQGLSTCSIMEKKSSGSQSVSRIPKRITNVSNGSSTISPNASLPVNVTTATITVVNQIKSVRVIQRKSDKPVSGSATVEKVSKIDSARKEFIRPRLVTIIRFGTKPRKAVRFLLNKKTARSFDQVLNDITESIKPDWGAVRRVYTINGKEMKTLEDFFLNEGIFIATPNDKLSADDFELDSEECKAIQPYVKASLVSKSSRQMRTSEVSKSPQRRPKSSTNSQNTPTTSASAHPKYIPLTHFPGPILEKYYVGDVIGDGNFAVVRECSERETGQKYALKIIDKSKCNGRDAPPEHEVAILKMVNHPNIILLYEQQDFVNELYVVMELVDGGDLFDAIAEAMKFSEEDSACMTRDIASALEYLHEMRIVHRDIKPENLLVSMGTNGKRRIKLGDFGLAQIVTGPLYTVCGTPTYVSPEILAESGYGVKVDVWALGVIVYVLLCGYPPFVSPTGEQEDLFDLILTGDYEFPAEHWDDISHDAKDLVARMIESDTDLRFSSTEVLQHPWLASSVEESNERRHRLYQRDFKFSVFEAMGLTTNNASAPTPPVNAT